ncbi:nucleosidase [Geobacter sulfurreducens]|jgi:adenosylhomocysteine nucleosidase|uniref:Nucleoside phosphorylase n=1 Tax=Geobacter sulfurreducens (strain ATCC 51573 / DSM 12127 / PCA) TaxID=243231 RepID=Q74BY1_GEOSL|nr:MTA/SAH nucleosidase [Geobacter sulfurreducens]AAR35273.1 nucleoside phosphorylase [Geobacter sulfurreducens PCA]ADI84735.1 nucleoside phosphorylase [Geobacter sulfurreducens KN400]AJY68145.1 MTA/SAH nucleosidase [Geobacter sulfurreducens]QVW33851.1 nucleosidase [Geobacter sulfurreducens]UAC02638.1 nucleosidase [Geobacter sulfurreducens]
MPPTTIGLIAAMPDETRPLLRRLRGATLLAQQPFPLWRAQVGDADIWLAQSGMGPKRAESVAERFAEVASPDVMVSFGFGGGVLPGLSVGDLVMGTWCLHYDGRDFTLVAGIDAPLACSVMKALAQRTSLAVTAGTVITSGAILAKHLVAPLIPAAVTSPVLDMETAAVASISAQRGIPLLALRAITDDAAEEFGFSLDEFTDAELNIKPYRVVTTLLRKPWIMPQLIRLARSSKRAGELLASAVIELVEVLPATTRCTPSYSFAQRPETADQG